MDPSLSFDVLLGFISHSDDAHDSSFMDLSIFEYLPVFCDITLSAPSSLTSQMFDIDYEIAQLDSEAMANRLNQLRNRAREAKKFLSLTVAFSSRLR